MEENMLKNLLEISKMFSQIKYRWLKYVQYKMERRFKQHSNMNKLYKLNSNGF